jgi:riboflavin synthase
MFTGIVTAIGEIKRIEGGTFSIASRYEGAGIAIGASICCDGCCLTVTRVSTEPMGSIFDVDVSNETLSRTTLGSWRAGHRINLERSLKLGDELGGHMVTGHVDGVAEIASVTDDGASRRFEIVCPPPLAPFVAEKGSVALAGTSLTVNTVSDNRFAVNLIPHSLSVTTWGQKRTGDLVNMEVDLMARYVARLSQQRSLSS